MTVRLADIRVSLEQGYGLAGGVEAVLTELATCLERLAGGGAPDPIDLRSLPLNPSERERLAALLGDGEVDVTLTLDGESRVRETGIAGVWWIEHRDGRDELITELLEVARVPEILRADAGDIARSAALLRERIAAAGRRATTEDAP
jgi:hydrogenase-1 operon protein HyaF